MAKLIFEGQLMSSKPGEFVPDKGANKGKTFRYQTLKFNTVEGVDVSFSADADLVIPSEWARKDLIFDCDVQLKNNNGATRVKITQIKLGKSSK